VIKLSELKQDAHNERVNMGVARAASSLRQMVREQVLVSVPAVKIVTRQQAAELVERGNSSEMVAVRQSFTGTFAGTALLIFPAPVSLELVRALVNDHATLEDIIDLENEALSETGNIVLNACSATIANVSGRPMRISLPSVVRGDGRKVFASSDGKDGLVMFLFIDFSFKSRDVSGYVAMLMELPAIQAPKVILSDYLTRLEHNLPSDSHPLVLD
jgi:chemotaxis protein CheC